MGTTPRLIPVSGPRVHGIHVLAPSHPPFSPIRSPLPSWLTPGDRYLWLILTGIGLAVKSQESRRVFVLVQDQPMCRSTVGNSPSAATHSEVVSTFLVSRLGTWCGPFVLMSLRVGWQSSPRALKGSSELLLISPPPVHASVNDNIHRELAHVVYSSIGDAAELMHHLGQHTLLAKIDIQDAYRLILIHPSDRRFLGVTWQGGVYDDCKLRKLHCKLQTAF